MLGNEMIKNLSDSMAKGKAGRLSDVVMNELPILMKYNKGWNNSER